MRLYCTSAYLMDFDKWYNVIEINDSLLQLPRHNREASLRQHWIFWVDSIPSILFTHSGRLK